MASGKLGVPYGKFGLTVDFHNFDSSSISKLLGAGILDGRLGDSRNSNQGTISATSTSRQTLAEMTRSGA